MRPAIEVVPLRLGTIDVDVADLRSGLGAGAIVGG
jgi:hypothetical protein